MAKKLRYLVTGGTGFLGSHVLPLLREQADVTVVSRSDPQALVGDLSFWDGRVNPQSLKGQFDVLLHMAGLYNLRVNKLESLRQNVMTTHTALAIAQKAEIPHFVHMSTVAVAVRERGFVVQPEVLDTEANFPDFYAYGKAYAEKMVRHWADGLESKLILRLGILVGDSQAGKIQRIDGPYHTPEGFKKIKGLIEKWRGPLPLPGRKNSRLPLVPVDSAAKAIVALCLHSRKENWPGIKSLHLTPKEGVSTDTLYRSALRHLGLPPLDIKLLERVPDFLLKRIAEMAIDFPKEELEYLLNLPLFDSLETRRILGEDWCPEFADYEDVMWKGYDQYVENHI